MKKIFSMFSVVLTRVCSLHSFAANTSVDDYLSGSPCPKHGCDQQWHGGVELKVAGTEIEEEKIGVNHLDGMTSMTIAETRAFLFPCEPYSCTVN
ncbi:hypothetical protein [Pseudoalteromonas lipolytica]|uniref:hypothetical protein n=1 Tax=Pseudoalteromonas lipolytica TaxID=570156 RepID=UPI003A97B7D1